MRRHMWRETCIGFARISRLFACCCCLEMDWSASEKPVVCRTEMNGTPNRKTEMYRVLKLLRIRWEMFAVVKLLRLYFGRGGRGRLGGGPGQGGNCEGRWAGMLIE